MAARVGLIGWPVEHSVSPAMHNAAFEALGLDWRYDLLPVRPGSLGEALPALVAQGYRGFNVTVPHKQEALALSSTRSEAAQAIGAANTLVRGNDGALHADNTDAPGFWVDLLAHDAGTPPGKALIMGTGGSARAVTHALITGGWQVHIHSRDPERARQLTRSMGSDRVQPFSHGDDAAQLNLIVNCTPVGMWPAVDESPWPEGVPIPPDVTLYDLVYNPDRTALMAQAEAAGARAIGGLGMLVEQGAIAFALWTGQQPPRDVMRAAAEHALIQVS